MPSAGHRVLEHREPRPAGAAARRRSDEPGALSLTRMQRLAGNAAVAGLVGRGAAGPGLVQRNVGWAKGSTAGRGWNLGEKGVGGVRRIPLEGLAEGFGEHAMIASLSSESAKGRAIVLVPSGLDPTLGIEVIVHLHGYTEDEGTRPYAGWRELDTKATRDTKDDTGKLRQGVKDAETAHPDTAPVRDVALDEVEQQLDESKQTQVVIILPQGGLKSQFGKDGGYGFNADTFVGEVVKRLNTERLWLAPGTKDVVDGVPRVDRITMSGHSGAGATLAAMAKAAVEGPPKAPGKRKRGEPEPPPPVSALTGDLILYDAMTWDQLKEFKKWALMRLNKDLEALAARKDPDKKLEYLQTAPKLRCYYSTGKHGGSYVEKYQNLEQAVDGWFADHAGDLGDIAGCLRANFSFTAVGTSHEELIRGVPAGTDRKGAGEILDAIHGLHAPVSASAAKCPPLPAPKK